PEAVRRAILGHRLTHETNERGDGKELSRREEIAPADHAVALHAEAERPDRWERLAREFVTLCPFELGDGLCGRHECGTVFTRRPAERTLSGRAAKGDRDQQRRWRTTRSRRKLLAYVLDGNRVAALEAGCRPATHRRLGERTRVTFRDLEAWRWALPARQLEADGALATTRQVELAREYHVRPASRSLALDAAERDICDGHLAAEDGVVRLQFLA